MDDQLAREMYREEVLELYKHPHNFGKMEKPSHTHRELNPLCGDEVTIQVDIKNKRVQDVKFQGKGCAISMSAASRITDLVKGKTIEEINKITDEEVLELMKIPIGPVRMKCAVLPLKAIKKTIQGESDA